MSGPAAADEPEGPAGGGRAAGALSPAAAAAVLADFRAWLAELAAAPEAARPPEPTVDLFTLVGQFTALRHEVNLQTRATRAAVEQSAEVLKQLTVPAKESADDGLRPVVKAVIDIADALALSLRQMEKFRDAVEPLLAGTTPEAPRPGFFARLFGPKPVAPPAADPKLRQLAASAADGYAMSLRRVERLLPTLELTPVSCTGEVFDPETMEAVEVAADTGQPSGTVVEVVRPGYRWRGRLFRPAQVKVAR